MENDISVQPSEASRTHQIPPHELQSIQTADTPTRRLVDFFSNLVSHQASNWTISHGKWQAQIGDCRITFTETDERKIDTSSLQLDILDPKANPEANLIASLTLKPRPYQLLKSQNSNFETHLTTPLSGKDKNTFWQKIDNHLAELEENDWKPTKSDGGYFYTDATLFAKQAHRTHNLGRAHIPDVAATAALVISSQSELQAFLDSSSQYPTMPKVGSPEDAEWRQNYASLDTNPVSEQYETAEGYERYLLHINEKYLNEVPLTEQHISALTQSSRQAWEMYQPYVRESDFGFWQLATLDVVRNMYAAFGEIPEPEYLATLHKGMMDSLMQGDGYYINYRAMRMNEEKNVPQGDVLTSGGLKELNQIQNRWNIWITSSYSRLFYAGLAPEQSLLTDPRHLFESLEGIDEYQLKYYIFAIEVLGVPPSEVADFYKTYFSASNLLDADDPHSQEYAKRLRQYATNLRDGKVPLWLPININIIKNISDLPLVEGNAFTGLLDPQGGILDLAPIELPTPIASTPTPTQTPRPSVTPETPPEKESDQSDKMPNIARLGLVSAGLMVVGKILSYLLGRKASKHKNEPENFSGWQ